MLAVGACVLWGSGTVATHHVLSLGIPAGIFTAGELASSVAFLVLACLLTRTPMADPRVFRRAGSIGLLEPGLVYLIMNLGLARTSATHASLITALQPVLIVLIGWLVLRQPFPKHLLVPMVAVLVGTTLVITENMTSEGAGLSGDVLVLIGTVIAAVYVLANSRIAHDLPPLALTLVQQMYAVALVLPLVAVQVLIGGTGSGPGNPWSWAWVPAIGIATSSLTFWLYLSSLRHLSAGAAGQFLAVIPIVGFAGSVVVLGEPAGVQALIGSVVVAAALVSVARQEHRSLDAVEHDAEVPVLPDEAPPIRGAAGR